MEKPNNNKITHVGVQKASSFTSAMALYLAAGGSEHLYTPVESFSNNKSNIPKLWNYAAKLCLIKIKELVLAI